MDARAYLRELSTALLSRVRNTDEREAGIGLAFGSQELRGAARALVDAGLLEPQAEREVLDEYDRHLRDRGHARPVSAAMWAQAGLRTQTPAAVAPSPPATPSSVHLEAVIAVGAELGDVQGGTVTGLALELWTGGLTLTYHVRAPLTAEAISQWQRHVRWMARDDLGNTYEATGGGGNGAPGGFRGHVSFSGPLATAAERVVIEAGAAGGDGCSAAIELPTDR